MALTPKHKIRYPVGSDPLNLATDLANLASDVDLRISHRGLPYFGKPYIESGGALSNPSGLNVAVSAGVACIDGQTFDFAAQPGIALAANTHVGLWMAIPVDANGYKNGDPVWSVLDVNLFTGSRPANSVLVGIVQTDAVAVTSMTPTYRGIIAPGKLLASAQLTSSSAGVGDKHSFTIVPDGVSQFRLEHLAAFMTHDQPAGNGVHLQARTGANGTGTLVREHIITSPGVGYALAANYGATVFATLDPPTTYYNRLYTAAGTPTLEANNSNRAYFRAIFDF